VLPLEVALSCHQRADVLRSLCRAFANAIFLPGAEGQFPLHHAMLHRCNATIVQCLLAASGTDPHAEHASMLQFYGSGRTEEVSLCDAYTTTERNGNSQLLTGLIAAAKKDGNGQLPLHQGLKSCCPWSSVKLVLAAYPEAVHCRDNAGLLPVHVALIAKYPLDGLKILLAASESPLPPDGQHGSSLLSWACQYSNKKDEVDALVELAISAGDATAAAAKADATGSLPLHWACQAKLVVNHGSQPRQSRSEQTQKNELATVQLIERIIDLHPPAVEVTDSAGRLPLHWAATSPHPKVVEYVLSLYQAGAATADRNLQIPIFYAIEHSTKLPVIELLLNVNDAACLSHFDAEGRCPLFHAMFTRSEPEIVDLLKSHENSPVISRETVPKTLRIILACQQLMRSEEDKRWDDEEFELEVDRANLFASVMALMSSGRDEPYTFTPKILYKDEEGMDYGAQSPTLGLVYRSSIQV
jgi:ankyrin repeat protein